jgi:DNA-binding LacI/PurR family transcriptional regulator
VSADSAAGTHLAMDHLWALGHRAIICVSDSRTYDGRLRIDRYERYMRDHGAAGEICVFVTDQEPEPAFELGRASSGSQRGRPATAVYATSDTTTIGLMQPALGRYRDPRAPVDSRDEDIDMAPDTIPPQPTSARPASTWAG